MTKIEKKLQEWRENYLISEETYYSILNYELNKKSKWPKNVFLYGLLIVSSFSIGLGIISIIAANWIFIPTIFKYFFLLGIHFSLIPLIIKYESKFFIKESLILLFIILIIAEIGLTSQTFHIQEKITHIFMFWGVLSIFPSLLSSITFIPFIVFFILHLSFSSVLIVELNLESTNQILGIFYLSFIIISLLFLALSQLLKLENFLMGLFYNTILFFFENSIITHIKWYKLGINENYDTYKFINLILIVLIFVGIFLIYKSFFTKDIKRTITFVLFGLFYSLNFFLEAPFKEEVWNRIIGTILFILLTIFISNYFLVLKIRWLFHLSIFIIMIRLWIVYIELFKDLTTTGIGLILFGLLIILSIYFYKIVMKKFRL